MLKPIIPHLISILFYKRFNDQIYKIFKMQQVVEELDFLFKKVSVKINRAPQQFEPFKKILKQNWFDSEESLKNVTDDQFQKMNIPIRVSNAIKEVIQQNNPNNYVLPKNNTNSPQYQQNLTQTMMQTMVYRLVERVKMQTQENAEEGIQILKRIGTIINNILKQPTADKYRRLKRSNQLINKTFWQHPSCMQFITKLGFLNESQVLYLPQVDNIRLFFIEQLLKNVVINHENELKQIKNEGYLNNQINPIKMPALSQQQIKELFKKQNLQKINYTQALDKLIQYRTDIMSGIPKDRRLKIYHKKYQQKITYVPQSDLQTQLNNTNDHDIFKYWKSVVDANRQGSKFQSRRKQEFEYLLKQKIYKQTCIKIKLPNQLIIEGYFGALQPLQSVFDWLVEILVGDMYLYTSPPVKRMVKQLTQSLDSLDSVPNGSFYLGFNEDWFIKKQFASLIQH